jgi:hypothetical protein
LDKGAEVTIATGLAQEWWQNSRGHGPWVLRQLVRGRGGFWIPGIVLSNLITQCFQTRASFDVLKSPNSCMPECVDSESIGLAGLNAQLAKSSFGWAAK